MREEMKYRKLMVYNKATDYVVEVYTMLKKFPKKEQYALCDQLRRAAVSIPSNIAEGVGRVSEKERAHFMEIAYGSVLEVNCQMEIAQRLGYISEAELESIDTKSQELASMLSGFRKAILAKS